MIRVVREFPATTAICFVWVVVFVLMIVQQGGLVRGDILPQTARGYGYLTVRDVMAGEVWRTLTATFIHFSLIHLGVNLFGLFQLGRLLESWYGSGSFLAIYVITAVVGNTISVGLKLLLNTEFPGVAAFRDVPSGGGSTVLCGLIAMLAVVGWRSRTRLGNVIKAEMVGILAFTALLGILIPIVDNFGHFGGAVAGAILGYLHKFWLRNYERPRARHIAAAVSILVLLSAAALQAGVTFSDPPTNRTRVVDLATLEREYKENVQRVLLLRRLGILYAQIIQRYPGQRESTPAVPLEAQPPGPTSKALRDALLNDLQSLERVGGGQGVPHLGTLRELSLAALQGPPSPGQKAEFVRTLNQALRQPTQDIARTVLILNEAKKLQAREDQQRKGKASPKPAT